MNLRSKRSRPLTRGEGTRRDDSLFIIATEDTHAPEQYFRTFRNPRIHVRVLPTEDGLSSPKHVLDRLEGYYKEYELDEDDELWLMLDTDHWIEPNHIVSFKEVCAQATQRGFLLAHSNPCFELWLLLHVEDLGPSEQFSKCQDVVRRLGATLGSYSKRRPDPKHFSRDTAKTAATRAEKLDESPDDRWPRKTGSHVYRVVNKLLSLG